MTSMPSTTAPKPSRAPGVLPLLLFSLATATVGAEPRPVDSLSQNDLQKAFRALREDAFTRDQLSDLAINRAALEGILEILGPGAETLPASGTEPPPVVGNLIAPLPGAITYIRVGVIDDALVKALTDLPASETETGLVLDLRCQGGDFDPALASRLASAFCPPGVPQFSLVDAKGEETEAFAQSPGVSPRQEEIVLLVNARTSPTAETAAAVIRFHCSRKCLIMGEPTGGRTARYETLELGEYTRLRYAKAGVRLPDGTSLFGKGITPDIPVTTDREEMDGLLEIADPKTLREYLTEKERPVLNEAALMTGTNPELPTLLEKSASASRQPEAPPVREPALRQALDFLATRTFLKPNP